MIKLRKLIEARIPTFRWHSKSGTPDDVIRVLHYLSAAAMKRNEDPKDIVSIHHGGTGISVVGMSPLNAKNTWMLANKKRMDDSIYYNDEHGIWYAHIQGDEFEPMNSNELKNALANWGT